MTSHPERLSQTPLFVLSSGRSGSTLLARMIHRHPELLCVSDLFEPVGDVPYLDRERRMSGAEFFEMLNAPSFPQRIAYWREQPTDELLHLPEDDDEVSLLLTYTLPFLTGGEPRALYEELREEMTGRGQDTPAGHFVSFCDWLRDRFGRALWVERTGGSLPHTRRIVDTWPEARYVHNFRDPRETAISMLSGSFFRLYLELERDPDLGEWDWSVTPPVDRMAQMLDAWVVDAVDALEAVPEKRRMDLAYEDLVTDTEETLLRFAAFVLEREPTEADRAWARRECEVVKQIPLRFPTLPAEEQRRLEVACRQSLEVLGYEPATIAT